MNAENLSLILETPIVELPLKAGWRIQQEWHQAFAIHYKNKYGKWDQQFKWEYFSEATRLFHGANAIKHYLSHSDPGFYIWIQKSTIGDKVFSGSERLPEISLLMQHYIFWEFFLFDHRFQWCLFFTHEDFSIFQPPGYVMREE